MRSHPGFVHALILHELGHICLSAASHLSVGSFALVCRQLRASCLLLTAGLGPAACRSIMRLGPLACRLDWNWAAGLGWRILLCRVCHRCVSHCLLSTLVQLHGLNFAAAASRCAGPESLPLLPAGILPATQIDCMVTGSNGALVPGTCYEEPVIPLCSGNGNVELKFGR